MLDGVSLDQLWVFIADAQRPSPRQVSILRGVHQRARLRWRICGAQKMRLWMAAIHPFDEADRALWRAAVKLRQWRTDFGWTFNISVEAALCGLAICLDPYGLPIGPWSRARLPSPAAFAQRRRRLANS